MARSNRLTLWEVRKALRVVGECRDLGHDMRAWITHAMHGIQRMLPARVVLTAVAPAQGFQLIGQTQLLLGLGWDGPTQEKEATDWMLKEQHLQDPSFQRYQAIARPNITLRPLELVSRREYEMSPAPGIRQRVGIQDFLFSQRQTPTAEATFCFSPQRACGDRPFEAKQTKLLSLFHSEVARLVGTVLSHGLEDPLAGLSPRLRETLQLLLAGDSEKEVALAMGISRHTVHEYVVRLYRRYEVNTRSELLVRCLRNGIRPRAKR